MEYAQALLRMCHVSPWTLAAALQFPGVQSCTCLLKSGAAGTGHQPISVRIAIRCAEKAAPFAARVDASSEDKGSQPRCAGYLVISPHAHVLLLSFGCASLLGHQTVPGHLPILRLISISVLLGFLDSLLLAAGLRRAEGLFQRCVLYF